MAWRRWASGLLLAGSVAVMAAAPDPVRYRWQSRVLLVFAAGDADAGLRVQRDALGADPAGTAERALVLLASTMPGSPDDAGLRRRYGVSGTGFAALLIGKDGGVKLRSASPIPASQLFQTIDAMPMRRQEAGRRG